jgi:hypothetical protein
MSASSFLRTLPAALVFCGVSHAGTAIAAEAISQPATAVSQTQAADDIDASVESSATSSSSNEASDTSIERPRSSQIAALAGTATARASMVQPGAGTNDAPRLIRSDAVTDSQPSTPGYSSEVSESSYRWWKSSGRADVGFGLGTITYLERPTGVFQGPGLANDNGTVATTGTVLTLGMRYRTSAHSAVYADAAGVRGPGITGDGVVGKVGIEFKAAQSRFNINYGGLGMKFAGDTRMTLRLRRGGLGVYMRRSF